MSGKPPTDVRWEEAAALFDTEPRKAVDVAEQIEREDNPAQKPCDERRKGQCSHDGCDSPCLYEVYLHVHYGHQHRAIETLKSSIRVCEYHKKQAHDFILSDHNKKNISARLATIGRLSIDWDNAMIEFVPVGEVSWGPTQMVEIQAGHA